MDVEAFEKRISQYLKKSKEEQVLYFAWHCAVRALPFLSVEGSLCILGKTRATAIFIYYFFYSG